MSIAYVGQSLAKSGQSDKLREFLRSVVLPAVRSSSGCESCLMLQSEDDPTRFIGIEVWTSVEAHRAAIKNIPPENIREYMTLVAGPPTGGYYRTL
jgi:quinol monooxygenase YgiN